ncbi:uroporphyrin-III C-methyltransferase [Dinoroseobacter shibae DFL 12 = DSM 16493]|jgi:uroporphyrin-III C-methyltransferase/precorrin-2 dehydrogenase/sirohydrochlorin ferrochelatase|uniref:Uroporphyrin-III C-methyltransferase n=1 Tax=Dinoroseobacter shibae (strain DSM 16493 / NCIMB 14021 / DFL 12) TaxID=398580 RepID=A8LHV0_DINSH|nr:siroheme synthase CysG [Dinoroseobacter shibae]ABV92897.1 uroporphyrin-III C-methyltransferase [Dinoroseobacter shibae DFL 12 = DSM 16493]URF47833.1 siroheme synthase CysG [Dinoroseobacter shibae]URF52142.1 siroheme synthase CysG [Dinoroseobacter shibae]
MQHFPIFLAVSGRRIVLGGGGDAALAKLRLLLKTQARLTVIAPDPAPEIRDWAAEGRLRLIPRAFEPGDGMCASLVYAATEDAAEDARIRRLAQADGALVNIVDNLADSQFITPAIVDRDPVTIAIGTEGAAPVLARAIKADLEAKLSPLLGLLAKVGKGFRARAEALPMGRARRDFWRDYYFRTGPSAADQGGQEGAEAALDTLLASHLARKARTGSVALVGAGPGDPELLTLKARKALDEADVVIHDRLVPPAILELARREATLIYAGKEGFGTSTSQEAINDLIVTHARAGAQVVRLKSGDPAVYGRLDEEIDALEDAGIPWRIVPGLTTASVAAATLGQSLTRRGRNAALRFLTGHDTKGFADHDWRGLARPGQVAAIYMGKRAARFLQGRLLMHGAAPATPVTLIENVSRPDQRVVATDLAGLADAARTLTGPAILMYGLAPRDARSALTDLKEFA